GPAMGVPPDRRAGREVPARDPRGGVIVLHGRDRGLRAFERHGIPRRADWGDTLRRHGPSAPQRSPPPPATEDGGLLPEWHASTRPAQGTGLLCAARPDPERCAMVARGAAASRANR